MKSITHLLHELFKYVDIYVIEIHYYVMHVS